MVAFIEKAQLEKYPAIMAEGPDPKRSDRYTFVSSLEIFDRMDREDWGLARVRIPNSRSQDPTHARHEMVFQPRDLTVGFEDPRLQGRIINHGNYHLDKVMVRPEIKINNSSDGSCALGIEMGLFALLCANGLTVVCASFGNVRMKHQGFDANTAYDLVNTVAGEVPSITEKIQEWNGITLPEGRRVEFASAARDIRFGDRHFDPKLLLKAHREEDQGNDLWTTFNVVQENLIKGGFNPNLLKSRKVRPLVNIAASNKVNSDLWELAEAFAAN